jgi:hypothetical protein
LNLRNPHNPHTNRISKNTTPGGSLAIKPIFGEKLSSPNPAALYFQTVGMNERRCHNRSSEIRKLRQRSKLSAVDNDISAASAAIATNEGGDAKRKCWTRFGCRPRGYRAHIKREGPPTAPKSQCSRTPKGRGSGWRHAIRSPRAPFRRSI